MPFVRPAFLALAILSAPLAPGASAADRASDYETVRRIALRDPKVRAAYDAADRKLADRIVEIDPTLKGYTPGRPAPKPAPVASAKPQPAKPAPAKPAPTPAPARRGNEIAHVVVKGDTLAGIASRYGVAIATLKSANKIQDERRLAVGQVLVVPGGKKPAASASKPAPKPKAKTASSKPAAAKKEESMWDKFMGNF